APARAGLLDREALALGLLAEREDADPVAREVLLGEGQPEAVRATGLEDPVADVSARAAVALDPGLVRRRARCDGNEDRDQRKQEAPAQHRSPVCRTPNRSSKGFTRCPQMPSTVPGQAVVR